MTTRPLPPNAGSYVVSTVRGNDEPEAEGNEDGNPSENSVYNNDLYTGREEAWKMNYADSNVFRVGRPSFSKRPFIPVIVCVRYMQNLIRSIYAIYFLSWPLNNSDLSLLVTNKLGLVYSSDT